MSAPKTERNKQVYEDKKTMSYKDLIVKYNLSLATLQNIIRRQENKELKEKAGN
jgi:Mor family transcriptional regulator